MVRVVVLVVLAPLLALGGCSLVNDPSGHMGGSADAGPSVDAGPEPIAASQYCNELAEFACESAGACCRLGDPTPTCVAEVRSACDTSFGTTILADPRTGYDPLRAGEAFARARVLAATCEPSILDWYSDQRTGFPSALAGSVTGGNRCTPRSLTAADFDIAAFYSCLDDDQACIFNGIDSWSCTSRASATESCYLDTDCQDNLFCDYGLTGMSPGRCAPQRMPGLPCTERGGECLDVCYMNVCVAPTRDTIYCAFAPVMPI